MGIFLERDTDAVMRTLVDLEKHPDFMSNSCSLAILNSVPGRIREACNLRRFVPPQGYLSPNFVEASFIASSVVCSGSEELITGGLGHQLVLGAWQALHHWPMFAVTPDLAEAMLLTDPPKEITWDELEWPIPAATFLVPHTPQFMEYFRTEGRHPPAISVGRVVKPHTTGEVENPNGFKVSVRDILNLNATSSPHGWETRHTLLLHYFDGKMQKPMLQHMVAKGEWTLDSCTEPDSLQTAKSGPFNVDMEDIDRVRLDNTVKFAVNLLAFMSSNYQPVERVTLTEAQKMRAASVRKNGKIKRDALYGVRWLGMGYRLKRHPLGGHHASPHAYWRRGHWRNQPFGAGRKQRRALWIEPVFCNADTNDGQSSAKE